MSDKEAAINWTKLWIDSEFSSERTRTIARYILSTVNADPPQSVVTLTLADYEALKAWAEGMFAKATLTAWSEANEFTVQVVEFLREFCGFDHNLVPIEVYDKAAELIDQWDRRRERLTEDAK